jgi:hypothetical protein
MAHTRTRHTHAHTCAHKRPQGAAVADAADESSVAANRDGEAGDTGDDDDDDDDEDEDEDQPRFSFFGSAEGVELSDSDEGGSGGSDDDDDDDGKCPMTPLPSRCTHLCSLLPFNSTCHSSLLSVCTAPWSPSQWRFFLLL